MPCYITVEIPLWDQRHPAPRHRPPHRPGHQRPDHRREERPPPFPGRPAPGPQPVPGHEAVAVGGLREDCGTVDAPIGRHPVDRKRMAVDRQNGREAVTHWRVLARYPGFTHVECRLRRDGPTRSGSIWPPSATLCWAMWSTAAKSRCPAWPASASRPAAAVHPSLHWTACGAGVSPPRLVPGCAGPALPPELTAPPRSFSQGGVFFSPAPHGRHRIEGCKTWWKRGCRAWSRRMGRPAGPAEHPGHLSAVPGSPHRGHRPLLGHPLPAARSPSLPPLWRGHPEPDLIPARLAVSRPGGWLPELLFSAVPGDSLHRSIPGGGSLCLGRAQCPCLAAGAGGCWSGCMTSTSSDAPLPPWSQKSSLPSGPTQ